MSDSEAGNAARQVYTDANFLYGTRSMLLPLARNHKSIYFTAWLDSEGPDNNRMVWT